MLIKNNIRNDKWKLEWEWHMRMANENDKWKWEWEWQMKMRMRMTNKKVKMISYKNSTYYKMLIKNHIRNDIK